MSAEDGGQAEIGHASTVPLVLPGPPAERRGVPPSLSERYQDITFVGEGGMGTVYRAMDPRLGRTVALKLLKGDDPELWRRFLGEARAQARIQHEHVCRVYEAGQADGEPYIAMQFIDGEPLSRWKDRLTLEQRVKLMCEIATAVHEAHRLGIIHRDIKPGNILVEKREDGSLKPYIMDFGLAREVSERGQTRTGAVVGTPAYMPPEQAKGDVRAMDRRSDVFSLGATLYDMIVGHPPFIAEHPWKLLMMVAYEDAPTIGRVQKGVPSELETIVMKCLERDPSRRYDSARSLAEDLQRFLDGEPIQAKRASVGYLLWKRARKHKLVAALLALGVASSLGFGGVWVRAQRQAAEQAELARELGEGVKEMELFLRAAYAYPLHDVERERDVVRARLAEIEQRMAAAGKVGEGPGHYAIGRGYLALGDPEGAREHLERAIAAGYSSPDLRYALGRAIGEIYQQALAETRRITNEEERQKKVAELSRDLRDPALGHLRAAMGARIEVPAYAEGLIALYEGKNEEAAAKAREAFEKAPWMHEAKKLEGDALFAEGSKYRHDAAFDYEKMKSYFEPAARAYAAASNMGRSDPEVHRAECELWEKMGWAALNSNTNRQVPFEAGVEACNRAVQASSRDGRSLVQRALFLVARANAVSGSNAKDSALTTAQDAVDAAGEALRARPQDVMAHYAVAVALYERAKHLDTRGQDVPIEDVIQAYLRVQELDPLFTWSYNELGQVYILASDIDRRKGRDARGALEKARRQFERALALDPRFSIPAFMLVEVLAMLVDNSLERGEAADGHVKAALDALAALDERSAADPWRTAYWKARTYRILGGHELALGRDPRRFTEAAIDAIRRFAGESPRDMFFLIEVARCRQLSAEHALREGLDPSSLLGEARRRVGDAAAINGGANMALRILDARIQILTIRAEVRRGSATASSFDTAFMIMTPVLEEAKEQSTPYQIMSEVYGLRAQWSARSGQSFQADLAEGLRMAEKALAKNPHMATAYAAMGQLRLVQARTSRVERERVEAARRAKEAFDAALRENALFARKYEDERKEIGALLP
ncbi:protein kinase domain-containing protein [Polyangium jinanense]|uniref:Serine/threonine protein kinase n=1 Tax=Polyangium jinanense TaxID=2829994 RepID=A0A9X3WY20_9BACT|nr:serine/threonine-protein kinase [Polyangium jinanense]MDC3952808.1 serine/threonine protein kinase [Polyangium jinanense]MDC3980427.1 serine/threonine protein kinase [Polyangium jinanense]